MSLNSLHHPIPPHRVRSLFLTVITAACVGLVLWIPALDLTLPTHYVARQWKVAWVGFDIGLVLALTWTAYLAYRGRQLLIVAAVITAAMLVCDAWFDVTLSWGTRDLGTSIMSAVLLELPLAALLIVIARRLLRLTVHALWQRLGLEGPVPRFRHLRIAVIIESPTGTTVDTYEPADPTSPQRWTSG